MTNQHGSRTRSSASAPPLLPQPRNFQGSRGSFRLQDRLPIVLSPDAGPRAFASARALKAAAAEAWQLELPIETHPETHDLGPHISLEVDDPQATGCEGDAHHIRVLADRIQVRGGGEAGLRYGVETLVQLVRRGPAILCCEIEDAPDFAMRGIMLDVSRGKVPTLETLRRMVDLCVTLKLNVMMLYTEHTFRFRRHPEIGANDSPLDAETMLALDEYAAERFVDLIPCLQSLGHMEHILKLPRYRALAETDVGWTIAPVHPDTIPLLRDLYDEYLPNFRSRYLNANCDEPWDLGQGQSQTRSEALGPGGLYLEHVGRLQELAARHAKRTMIWGDVVHAHPERIAEIDKDLVLLDWWYEATFDYDRIAVFPKHRLDFGVCPGTSSWNSLFPRIANSIANISGWAKAGREHGALAFINTDWGDLGHYNLQGNSFFGFAWGAQQSWSGEASARDFDRAFSASVFGDSTGTVARIYRALGAIHDPGFTVFNGSPLQYLYFDDVAESYFIKAAREPALERCTAKLEAVIAKISDAREAFGPEEVTWRELAYAADASLFSVHKTQAARRFNAWRGAQAGRKSKGQLDARARARLAKELRMLADRQRTLTRRLKKLWLARSAISNFDITKRRIDRSVKSLRDAARALDRNRPPQPVSDKPFTMKGVFEAARRTLR